MALRTGSRGAAVRALQEGLIERGHLAEPADGHFGPVTKAAVEAFQREEGLTVDGVAGPQTLGALGLARTRRPASSDYHVGPDSALGMRTRLLAAGRALGLGEGFCDEELMSGDRAVTFADYLTENGVTHFSVDEAVRPNHPNKARQAGFSDLTPPRHLWPWAVLVLTLGDRLRAAVGAPVTLRNLYRPMSYNRLVATSGIRSDHPNAAAGDFDFRTGAQRRTAEGEIRRLAAQHPELEVSLGLGARTLHVGCLSPKGSRSWYYDSYPDERVPFP